MRSKRSNATFGPLTNVISCINQKLSILDVWHLNYVAMADQALTNKLLGFLSSRITFYAVYWWQRFAIFFNDLWTRRIKVLLDLIFSVLPRVMTLHLQNSV